MQSFLSISFVEALTTSLFSFLFGYRERLIIGRGEYVLFIYLCPQTEKTIELKKINSSFFHGQCSSFLSFSILGCMRNGVHCSISDTKNFLSLISSLTMLISITCIPDFNLIQIAFTRSLPMRNDIQTYHGLCLWFTFSINAIPGYLL